MANPRMLRVATADDIERVAGLAREIWTHHYVPIIGRPQTDYMLAHFQSAPAIARQLAEGCQYFVAQADGEACGYFALLPDSDGGGALLSKLYVRAAQRRQGMGRDIVNFAVRRCAGLGLRELRLTVNRHNAGSIAFYQRAGFDLAGTVVQDIGGGFVMDDFRMVMRLPPDDAAALGRCRGCLLGLAAGDAVGTTVEFRPRGTFRPVTDMTGGGPFGLAAGQWTDDTSTALCLAESLAATGRFDPADQMDRYVRWQREGHLSATGACFDIGGTTSAALQRYERTGDAFAGSTDSRSAGNGSLMRLAPVPIFFRDDAGQAILYAGESSRTTHGAAECVDACRLFGHMLCRALDGASKDEILSTGHPALDGLAPKVAAIADGAYAAKPECAIRGSGYVVDCLEAALWCFRRAASFREAVLLAANLGDDADTTAAVCGQIAGAHYGASGIPEEWRRKLAMSGTITSFADRLGGRAAGMRDR